MICPYMADKRKERRSIHDALCVVRSLVKKKALIAGGSAPEMEVAQKLEAWARRGAAISVHKCLLKVFPTLSSFFALFLITS